MRTTKKAVGVQEPVHKAFEVRFVLNVYELTSLPPVEWLAAKRDEVALLASTISTDGRRLVPGSVSTSAKVDLLCSLGQEVDCLGYVIAHHDAITSGLTAHQKPHDS